MSRDRDLDALRIAAAPTLKRIRSDRKRAPSRLKKVFTVIAGMLFDHGLNASSAWRKAGIKDHSLTAAFKVFAGCSLRPYIAQARIDVAEALLRITDLELSTISLLVGYTNHSTFIGNYVRIKNVLPSEVPRVPPARPLIDDTTSLRAGRGQLDDDESADYLEKYLRLYPKAAKAAQPPVQVAPEARFVVDGARGDRLAAEGLWREIRDLPFEEQQRRLRQVLFCSTVLFDLLREKSRQHGRKSRRRGIEIAKLALVSLEGSDEVFGERIHDLRALGWAWLGNAHRLALDLSAADAAFEESDVEWLQPDAPHETLVAAEIDFLKGSLRMSQRSYPEALSLIDRSRELFRLAGDSIGETKALLQKGAVHVFADRSLDAIAAFGDARALLAHHGEPFLTYAVYCNLANAQAKAGLYQEGAANLSKANVLCQQLDNPLESLKILWVDGVIKQGERDLPNAEKLIRHARSGYQEAEEICSFALASLDLAVLLSEQQRWSDTLDLTLEVVPLLESLRLNPESLAAISLLSKALETKRVSPLLLRDVRDTVHRDPLTALD